MLLEVALLGYWDVVGLCIRRCIAACGPFPLSVRWNSSTAACAACWAGQAQQGSGPGNYHCLPETGVPLLLIRSWAGPSQCYTKQWYDGNRTGHRKGYV